MTRTTPLIILACLGACAAFADDPWADTVLDFDDTGCNTGFCDPSNATGPPSGAGSGAGSTVGVHSIGTAGSFVTVGFNTPIVDDPQNPQGLDFIVFGNAFYVGGNIQNRWAEPGIVEVSADQNNNGLADDPWYVIPGSRGVDQSAVATGIPNPVPPLIGNFGVTNPNFLDADLGNDNEEFDWGYSDMNPVRAEYLDRYLRPDDPFTVGISEGSGGGDAFDIAWAVDASGNPANLNEIDFVRVWTLLQNGGVGAPSTEISAIADVAPDVDTDQDGILDEWETRVSNTDPLRKESTVLPLELPADLGGSGTPGTLLGSAADSRGNAISLSSIGFRNGARNMSVSVDLTEGTTAATPPAGRLLSGAALRFESSEPDFDAAQVDWAALTLAYTTADIVGLDESSLAPRRDQTGTLIQDGIRDLSRDASNNRVTFYTRYPGTFVLVAPPGTGDSGPQPGPPVGPVSIMLDQPSPNTVKPILLHTDAIRDAVGMPMNDGTLLTLGLTGATFASADADASQSGHQSATQNGALRFAIRLDPDKSTLPVEVTVYGDSAQTDLLGTATFNLIPGFGAPLPLAWPALALSLMFAGYTGLQRRRR